MDSRQKALLAAQAAGAKHAEGVIIIDLRSLSTVTDYFVICTAQSTPQMTAVKEHIEEIFAKARLPIWHTEGTPAPANELQSINDPRWLLLDGGDVVIHILDAPGRSLYRLEEMWADAPRVSLPPDSAFLRKAQA